VSRSLGPRSDLFKMLVENESGGLVDCMVGHFEQMTKFTPALDEIVVGDKQGRKRR
jgi:hypothetical protein